MASGVPIVASRIPSFGLYLETVRTRCYVILMIRQIQRCGYKKCSPMFRSPMASSASHVNRPQNIRGKTCRLNTFIRSINNMKTIFITISRGSLIRNFFHSGMVSYLLDAGMRVVVLTPSYGDPALFKEYAHERLILEPLLKVKNIRFHELMLECFKGAVFNQTVHSQYLYRIVGTKRPNRLFYLPATSLLRTVCFYPRSEEFPSLG